VTSSGTGGSTGSAGTNASAGTNGSAGRGGTTGTAGRGGTTGTAGTGGGGGATGGVSGRGGASGAGGVPVVAPIVINFDDQPDGPLSPGYAGLTWDSDWYVYHNDDQFYHAHSGTQFITNLNVAPKLSFTFPAAVHFLGAWFSHYSGAPIQLEAHDATDAVIGTSPVTEQTLVPVFIPLDVRGVKKVTVIFNPVGTRTDFSMDDVTYSLQ
jgi:hypothetical protein